MNGNAFSVRHKEWAIECLKLAYKSMPWIMLLLACNQLIINAFTYMISSLANDSNNDSLLLKLTIAIIITLVMQLPLTLTVLGPLGQAILIIIHRIDQGAKNDPITLSWYIIHDRNMWLSHIKNTFSMYKYCIILMTITYMSLIVYFILAGTSPSEDEDIVTDAASLAYKAFFEMHPLLSFYYKTCVSTITNLALFIGFREMCRFKFNSFMFANSYKSYELCIEEARRAKRILSDMRKFYLFMPFAGSAIISAATSLIVNPIVSLISCTLVAGSCLYIVYMNYIIGRDYYIGPPAKKVEKDIYNSRYANSYS
ncbi:hypothetical protein ACI2KR_08640 [Pseudomonas luteola]